MPTYDATEAHRHIKPEMMDDFRKTMAEAEAGGKAVSSVISSGGVPLVYSVKEES